MEDTKYNEILLDSDGRMFLRKIDQFEVGVNDEQVRAALCGDIMARINGAMTFGQSECSLAVKATGGDCSVMATLHLPFIRLNTQFRLREGVMTPVFEKPGDCDLPVISVDWNVATATAGKVRLWLLVAIEKRGNNPWLVGECYLVATSSTNRMYRIPLANVYDDTRVCMGEYHKTHDTMQDAIAAALEQFLKSPYNSDLKKPLETSDAFFRFKPLNDGFQTLPVDGQWSNLCSKASLTILDQLILPAAEGGAE